MGWTLAANLLLAMGVLFCLLPSLSRRLMESRAGSKASREVILMPSSRELACACTNFIIIYRQDGRSGENAKKFASTLLYGTS